MQINLYILIGKRDRIDNLSLKSNVVIIRSSEYDDTGSASAASLLDAQVFGDEAVTSRL